jgi:predicted ATPase
MNETNHLITKIVLTEDYKSLKKWFQWNDIPKFSVIAGYNGSGKSQLLNQIYSQYHKDAKLISSQNFYNLDQQGNSLHQKENTIQECINFLNNRHTNRGTNIEPIIRHIEQEVSLNSNEKLTERLIREYFPKNYWEYVTDYTHPNLGSVFKSFQIHRAHILEAILQKVNREELRVPDIESAIIKEVGIAPWKKMNELFSKYGFSARVTEPETAILNNYSLFFYHENDVNTIIASNDLSTGEKTIVKLIFLAYDETIGYKNKALFFDEPDAHLNPRLSKMLIEIIYAVLVKERGIQIIMTTHRSSTIDAAPDESLFWMKEGSIQKMDKAEIIENLSEGRMSYSEVTDLMSFIAGDKRVLLLTEGRTDIDYIEKAANILGEANILKHIKIINLRGASAIRYFLLALLGSDPIEKKIVIGLFDYDDGWFSDNVGEDIKNKLSEKDKDSANIYMSSQKNIFAVHLEHPIESNFKKYEHMCIEFLFPIDFLLQHKMLGSKTHKGKEQLGEISESNHPYFYKIQGDKKDFSNKVKGCNDIKIFENFRCIFDAIKKIKGISWLK